MTKQLAIVNLTYLLLGGFAALMLCFVLRFTQTAVAEIKVKTATVAGLVN